MSDNETATTRVITIRLRMPALVLISVLFIGGLIWAFVLGIMVGRGQMNDELEALRPAPQQIAADEAAEKAADEIEKLIKAEDLKYQESLRQNTPTPAPATSAQTDPASLAQVARNDSTPARQAQVTPVAPPAPAGQQYSYLYQVASYTKESQAKDMQAKLKAKGMNAQIETKIIQDTSWFRILISFKGDESSVKSMQDMLKKDFKINSTLLRGKTALGG